MSSDVLRRAAARLREAAASATAGPWEVGPNFGARDNRVYVRPEGGFDWVGSTDDPHKVMACQVANVAEFRANAAFVALMHPPVALALADWLDVEAANMHGAVEAWSRDTGYIDKHLGGVKQHTENMFAASLALARAILREDS